MSVAAPKASPTANFICNGGEDEETTHVTGPEENSERTSMYVELFEDMIKTVLKSEHRLFSHEEIGIFKAYDKLSYEARFLLVRLSLRKADKWFRVGELNSKYVSELGQNIPNVMDELCTNAKDKFEKDHQMTIKTEQDLKLSPKVGNPTSSLCGIKVKQEEIKIKLEDLDAGPSSIPDNSFESTVLAEHEDYATLPELLNCLSNDELRTLSKKMRVNGTGKREKLIQSLSGYASKQAVLSVVPSKSKGKDSRPLKQSQLSFTSKGQSQQHRLRQLVVETLQKCIRINSEVIEIFRRLHLVYYRCTQYSLDFLVPSILARSKKRHYFKYKLKRTANIWSSREALLKYQDALIKEFKIDEILNGKGPLSSADQGRSTISHTPAPIDGRPSPVPSTPGSTIYFPSSSQPPDKPSSGRGTHEEQSRRVRGAKLIKDIFEPVYLEWKALFVKPDPERKKAQGLERFDFGHVLTRIVCKGANALGVLREYDYELEVLEALLSQDLWRTGKRGGWHDRRALIMMTHMPKDHECLQAAKVAVEAALDDPHTHSIWLPKLERRLVTLEKRLEIPLEHRRRFMDELAKPNEVTVVGERIYSQTDAAGPSNIGSRNRKMPPPLPASQSLATQYFPTVSSPVKDDKAADMVKIEKVTGKSIWKGKNDEKLSVEMFALQHYESLGYKGFHSEGRIVCTIYGLLFWDIIFAPIPGAFETPFQTAPLDIADDTFYTSREDMIDDRLSEIREGKAPELLEANDNRHRETETWCVGVRWDLCGKQDLLDIIDCLGPTPLSEICRIISEDYSSKASGLPDLIVWDTSKAENRCMFVEVKGPGDSLQENQKTWLDLLIRADVAVEVCRVADKGDAIQPRSRKRKRTIKPKNDMKEGFVVSSTEDELVPDSEEDEVEYTPRKRQHSGAITDSPFSQKLIRTPVHKKRRLIS